MGDPADFSTGGGLREAVKLTPKDLQMLTELRTVALRTPALKNRRRILNLHEDVTQGRGITAAQYQFALDAYRAAFGNREPGGSK